MSQPPAHEALDDPCLWCGWPARLHKPDTRRRPQHASQGDPCSRCGLAASSHNTRKAPRTDTRRRMEHPCSGDPCETCGKPPSDHIRRPRKVDRIVGLDGEGISLDEHGREVPHRYVYLAARDAEGEQWEVENRKGLSTVECFDFILELPKRALIIGFSLGYDHTMLLADMPNRKLQRLLNPKARLRIIDGQPIYSPVRWKGYRLNYLNRRLTVARGTTSRTVWDFFKFFQSKFTRALIDWKVTTRERLDEMERMKGKRSKFTLADIEEIKAYCLEECRYLAQLGRTLIDAHETAGLPLRTYNGPGSSASVLLNLLGIGEKRGTFPEAMRLPIASAFFGGRFENSWCGPVKGPIYVYDLASAYPYAATFLPCLEHGRWRFVKHPKLSTIERATLALIHWRGGGRNIAGWGGLPVRDPKGSILFPSSGDGGWVWRREFLAALRFGRYEAREAWVYETDCDCRPFGSVPTYYRERVRLGKDGPGRVIKLALNSATYGKLAQSEGVSPPFQSWIWAGNVTSDTRAELLEAIARARVGWDVLMVATDGAMSRKPLQLRKPRDTGTADLEKPLGVWESKVIKSGVFLVRPGIYFPLDPKADADDLKSRGIGKSMLADNRPLIARALKSGAIHTACKPGCKVKTPHVTITGLRRFVGAKSALHLRQDGSVSRSPDYGQWVDHPIRVGFDPRPKRDTRLPDGRMTLFGHTGWESLPYDAAKSSPEAESLLGSATIREEQPDGDFEEMDDA